MKNKEMVRKLLMQHEGLRLKPYRCTAGKITIGYGRNLDDVGITEQEALSMLNSDIDKAEIDARSLVGNFGALNDARQAVVVDMCFNLGKTRFSKFKRFLSALDKMDYKTASHEMLDSNWAVQVGQRAVRLSRMMENGI